MIGLHMLNPLSGAAAAASSSLAASGKALSQKQLHKLQHQQQQQAHYEHQQANIVRISAKTAQPVAVSSVPKCRQAKGLRSHPLDTINGTNAGRPLMSEQVRPISGRASGGGRRSMSMDQLEPQAGDGDDQRVLLIVNEDHIRGGGVPIIGRRLASKSVALRSSRAQIGYPSNDVDERLFATKTNAEYPLEPPAIRMDQIQAAPIVGRRSHRLQLSQQQYEYHDVNRGDSQQRTSSSKHCKQQQQAADLKLASSQANQHHLPAQTQMLCNSQLVAGMQLLQQQQQQQQQVLAPFANPANGSGSGQQQGGARRKVKSTAASKQSSANNSLVERRLLAGGGGSGAPMLANVADQAQLHNQQLQQQRQFVLDELQSTSKIAKRQVSSGGGSRGRRIVADSTQTAAVVASSCSSLCELQQQRQQCYEANCCCCSATCNSQPEFAVRDDEAAINGCQKVCCRPSSSDSLSSTAGAGCNLARSASCQRIAAPPCCAANVGGLLTKPPTAPAVATSCNTRCHHHHHQQQLLQQSSHHHHHHHQQHSKQHQSHHPHHHHHQSCEANGSHQANDNSKRRPSSLQTPTQPMLMSRNVLPVAPKPIVNYQRPPPSATIVLASCQGPAQEQGDHEQEQEDPVAQMYESLAAELKAKLGNPKFGPILLPPKDYDTMSRKQGKLSGIELRRSTNPQLVGPTANTQRPLQSTICEETSKQQPALGACSRQEEQHHQHTRTPAQSCSTSSGSGCCCCNNSARSSCRSSSHTARTVDDGGSSSSAQSATSCLQRSRSNSSSGLGSISVGAGSPNSSPSSKCSSSEDMRHTAHTKAAKKATTSSANNKVPAGGEDKARAGVNGKQVKHSVAIGANVRPKNCSPDNCAGSSSDSGHSGSGRLDNRALGRTSTTNNTSNSCCLTNEEQRIMLRDTSSSDEFFNSKSSIRSANARVAIGNNNRGKGIEAHNPAKVSDGVLWNGRVEIPLKVNNERNGNTYLATKQIIY